MNIKSMPWWATLLTGTALIIILGFIFSFFNVSGAQQVPSETGRLLLKILLVSPLLETLLGQIIPVEMCNAGTSVLFRKEYPVASVLLSASLFGLLHIYSPVFFIYSFLSGLVLACSYLAFKKQKGLLAACILTALMHLLVNLISFGINAL